MNVMNDFWQFLVGLLWYAVLILLPGGAFAVLMHFLLSLPMQRICREDCQGICPICGQNRNLAECGCQVKTPDDRWAALRNL